MLWVCRAGMKAIYLDYYLNNSRVYLPWDGFNTDLSMLKDMDAFRKLVLDEKGEAERTSVSNWAGQLYSFCRVMRTGDYVLIPHLGSRKYTLAQITGEYEYSQNNEKSLWHSRTIRIIKSGIDRNVFSQTVRYSLGAFRTLFKVKYERECLDAINNE